MNEEDFITTIMRDVNEKMLPNQTIEEALERAAALRFRQMSDAGLMILVRAINREARRRLARDKRAFEKAQRNKRRPTDVIQE